MPAARHRRGAERRPHVTRQPLSLALARKYRPKRFADVAVQSHVSNTLRGAIARGRIAHAYLLCGPRGVGKTTLARVLAMALNCERRPRGSDADAAGGEPCGECPSCQRIWSGASSLDVVEIDAASNRGVDDARDLRERAMYAPSGDDGYKVYIVDEAHMLTREAWNALLKVLEEPPPRVVFVFATTEPQKIAQQAAPVLSRLQRFDLKRIGPAEIRARLDEVLRAEGVAAEPEAMAMLARAADGSMRDALSLADQVLAAGDGTVTTARVREALGLVAEDEVFQLIDLVAERRAADVFPAVARLADAGVDFATLLAAVADALRAQLAVVLGGEVPDVSERAREELRRRKDLFAAGDLLRMLAAISELEPRFRKSGQQQLLVETLLLRFALLDRAVAIEDVLRELGGEGGGAGRGAARGGGAPTVRATIARQESRAAVAPRPADETRRTRGPSRAEAPRADEPPPPDDDDVPFEVRADFEPALGARDRPATSAASVPPTGPRRRIERNLLDERWGEVVDRVRAAGSQMLATALEHAAPSAVSGRGEVTLELDGPNEILERAFESGRDHVLGALRALFDGVERVALRANAPADAAPRRVTHESIRAERVAAMRRRDPALGAAIDALDLEVLD
ncbi:MAG TPA: DNA polymerase III subunit gamma/tau [Gemmatimonadaceae bacterium]|nr:DNA polymerase III subunit gamma/tau [Gemmatimonadaceae bacterium]